MECGCRLPVFDGKECYRFALGRNAMYAAALSLGLKEGDEVLTPAFDCDGSLQPFKALGLKLDFFHLDPYTFMSDISDIRRRITPRTKLLHIINHFGFPQPWDALIELRRETGIPILEDNAYSLFSQIGGKRFGTFGDVAIFSLRKNLPVCDGGILCVNNRSYKVVRPSNRARWLHSSEYSAAMRLLIKKWTQGRYTRLIRILAAPLRHLTQAPPPLYSDSPKGWPEVPSRDSIGNDFACDYLRPMSRLASRQLAHLGRSDFDEIVKRKRSFYNQMAEALKGLGGVRILWPVLPEGLAPFCLCLILDSGRDNLLQKLSNRYDVMAWPTLPAAVLDRLKEYPEVELLGRRLLQINLPADMVMTPCFSDYARAIVEDIRLFYSR